MKWEKGRLHTGYDKMLLATGKSPVPFDFYLLRFNEGAEAPEHTDSVKSGKHYRLNILIKKARSGGEFKCSETLFKFGRVVLFRPDKHRHLVTKVISGRRYVLSLGWIRNSE